MPVEFLLFGLTLAGVAVFHRRALPIAATGLAAVVAFEWLFTQFPAGPGITGLVQHFAHEWVVLANLLLLLVGFTLVAAHFEQSGLPAALPRHLPDNWVGAFALLVILFVVSAFLDNIAAALIGGAMAHTLFGDTTTTMMWITGVEPLAVLHAYVASVAALLAFGFSVARQQQRYSPIVRDATGPPATDWIRVLIVVFVLASAIAVNVAVNLRWPILADRFPFIGAAVALTLLLTVGIRAPDWHTLPGASRGALFLLCLVALASLMPVERLPEASWQTAFVLGFVSAFFDNIPLTAIALKQGGYDWGVLAYAVGFGGSMLWFGSSAGVAICSMFPEARSTGRWLREGWLIPVAYVVGFAVLLVTRGWQPSA